MQALAQTMLGRGSTALFSLAGLLSSILALFLASSMAMALLSFLPVLPVVDIPSPSGRPHLQLFVFSACLLLSLFLLVGAVLMVPVIKYIGAKPGHPLDRGCWIHALAHTTLINFLVVFVVIILVFRGIATPLEAMILGCVVLLCGLIVFKQFLWKAP